MQERIAQQLRILDNICSNVFGAIGYEAELLRQEITGKYDQHKLEGASGLGRTVGDMVNARGRELKQANEATRNATSPSDGSSRVRQGITIEKR
jgi:hypothetical protein